MLGSIKNHRNKSVPISRICDVRVLSVHYRLAPEFPFPAQLKDAIKVYEWLLMEGYKPSDVLLMGFSAGGALSLSLLLKLKELGMELPKGAVLKSPVVDFAMTGDSVVRNAPLDPALGDSALFLMIHGFVGDSDSRNPLLSPYYGELSGLPPILLQIGTHEMLYNQCKMFAEKAEEAGVDFTFQDYPEMVHAWHGFDVAEKDTAYEKIREFVDLHFVI